ncbi:hypothetical protein J9303_10500 [Bacillaceae bacterium Marseille-Q3522]|nr:hypothetical protein [Bacillaceae bacterium Marseille-Q3522]
MIANQEVIPLWKQANFIKLWFSQTLFMGPMYQARDICQVALLQDAIPSERRAGIMAARNAFLTPWYGITVFIAGFFADLIGVQTVYFIAGLLYLFAALIAFQQKSLRNYSFSSETN